MWLTFCRVQGGEPTPPCLSNEWDEYQLMFVRMYYVVISQSPIMFVKIFRSVGSLLLAWSRLLKVLNRTFLEKTHCAYDAFILLIDESSKVIHRDFWILYTLWRNESVLRPTTCSRYLWWSELGYWESQMLCPAFYHSHPSASSLHFESRLLTTSRDSGVWIQAPWRSLSKTLG